MDPNTNENNHLLALRIERIAAGNIYVQISIFNLHDDSVVLLLPYNAQMVQETHQ